MDFSVVARLGNLGAAGKLTESDRDTLFGPRRIKARAIDWDQIHVDFHQGARRQSRNQDAV